MGFGNLGVKEAVEQSKGLSSGKSSGPAKTQSGETSNINSNTNSTTEIGKENTKSGGTQNRKGTVSLRYPNNRIDSTTDYLEIKIVEYTPNSKLNDSLKSAQSDGAAKKEGGNSSTGTEGGFSQKQESTIMGALKSGSRMETATSRARKAKTLAYITLPIPQNVGDTNSIDFDADTLTPLKALAANLAMTGMTNPGALLQGMKDIKGFGTIDDNLRSAILSHLAGSAVGAPNLMTRATGQVLNPNMEIVFKGPQIRQFDFDFQFAPRSMSEAQQVKQIIRTMKQHAMPKGDSGGGFFIKSPDVFMLAYKKGGAPHPFLNVMKPMALQSIAMNYTGSNTYSTFHDGTPTVMTMKLSLKELNPIYFEHYDEGEGTIGVGY